MDEQYRPSVVSVKHTYFESAGTPEAELVSHLRGRAGAVLYIHHPFPDATAIPLNSRCELYDADGVLVAEKTALAVKGPAVLHYIKDVVMTVLFVLGGGRKYDLFVGSDNLNTFAGLILRALGRVGRVVYYVIDFTPRRFDNRLMNAVYQSLNKLCCYHADWIWNVSPAMTDGRGEIGIRADRSAPQLTVPLGCAYSSIQRKSGDEIELHTLVYFGMLRAEHGPGLVLGALPSIVKRFPDARVVFAGDGELRGELERTAAEMGIADHVTFTGFLPGVEEVYDLLTGCGLALATYPPGGDTYKRYSDPGKVKIYLACGLPVLITDVPAIANTIRERDAGMVINHSSACLSGAVCAIFGEPERYDELRENAVSLGAEYDWQAIWERTFREMNIEFPSPE